MKFATALGKELALLGALGGAGSAMEPAKLGAPPGPLPASDAPREPELPSFLQPAATAPSAFSAMAPAPAPAPSMMITPSPAMVTPAPSPPALVAPAGPPVAPAASKLSGTGDLNLQAVLASIKQGPLPFAHSSAPSPASVPEKTAPKPRRQSGTLSEASSLKYTEGPLPFARPSPPAGEARDDVDFTLLPLETYASVSRALAHGEAREEALAKHHVSAETFDRLAKAWSTRFQREPHLLARFKELATGK
jgi:hypothetical protein